MKIHKLLGDDKSNDKIKAKKCFSNADTFSKNMIADMPNKSWMICSNGFDMTFLF